MKFNTKGTELNISDELIERYLRETDVSDESLPLMINIHYRRATLNPDTFGTDINKAVEASILNELRLWEPRPYTQEPHTTCP